MLAGSGFRLRTRSALKTAKVGRQAVRAGLTNGSFPKSGKMAPLILGNPQYSLIAGSSLHGLKLQA